MVDSTTKGGSSKRSGGLAEARRQWAKHYSEKSAQGLYTVAAISRAAHIVRAGAEETLVPFGVSFGQFELLTLLMWSRSGGLPMSKISSRLHVPAASLTHTVQRLESAALIARVPNPRDRRSTLVSITDQGIALATAAGPVLSAYFESLPITPDQHELLSAGLETIIQQ